MTTCNADPPGGPANCGLVDGILCGGMVPDGGFQLNDAGLPLCGSACCSRNCSPYGPMSMLICQPASGCHVVGDLCQQDKDCCGSNGLPGGSGKPVVCDKSGGYPIGICRNGLQTQRRHLPLEDDVVQRVVRLLHRQLPERGQLPPRTFSVFRAAAIRATAVPRNRIRRARRAPTAAVIRACRTRTSSPIPVSRRSRARRKNASSARRRAP